MESLDNIVERIFQAHTSSDPVGALHVARKLLDAYIKARIQRAESGAVVAQLRDQFAGAAMQSFIVRSKSSPWLVDSIVRNAYEIADAMLEARNA